MPLSARRRRLRVQLVTLPTLMQQSGIHWEQVDQALQTDELHLERLQQRLNALQQILALEPTLPLAPCPALVAKVQALASEAENLQERIARERMRCQMLEQVFEDAQRAQSILLKQREKDHHRRRLQIQHLLHEICAQAQHAAISLAQEMPGGIVPPIGG